MKYGAITLDTSIFDQKGLKLESGILKNLEQFNGKPAGLVLSEIVLREVNKHLSKKIEETRLQIKRAIHQSDEHLPIDPAMLSEIRTAITTSDSDQEISDGKIHSFIERTGAIIIKAADHVDLSSLIHRYFSSNPPFADTGKKKNEFPDAIALMSLESFAKQTKCKILAVSADSDWFEFGKHSEWIDVVNDLAEGIAAFQPQKAAFEFCEKLSKELLSNSTGKISTAINSFLSEAVVDLNAYPKAESDFVWKGDYTETDFLEFELLQDEEDRPRLYPVQYQAGDISIALSIRIRGSATCEFSLSVNDSTDEDSMPMGTTNKTIDFDFSSELLLSASGDFERDLDKISIYSFDLVSSPKYIDFGFLEPDWWHD